MGVWWRVKVQEPTMQLLDPRWRKVGRDLTQHRLRSALVVLALATALAAAGTVLVTWALVRVATVEGYRASLPASATLRLADVPEAELPRLLQAVRAMPGIAAVRARRVVSTALQGQGAWRSALLVGVDVSAAAHDGRDGQLGLLRSEQGAWPPPLGSLAIERSSLEFSAITLGDAVALKTQQAAPSTATAQGVVRDVSLAPGWMENLVVAFATRPTLAALGLGGAVNELQIRVSDAHASRADVRGMAAQIGQLLHNQGMQVTALEVPVPGQHVHARQMNSLLLTQAAFAVLALAVSALLVVNLQAAILAQQRRQWAVMKVLGATPRALAAMVLAQAALLGGLAAALAVPAAAWAGRRYGAMKAELLNFPIDSVALPWWPLALLAAVALAVPMLAALPAVRRTLAMSVGHALRDFGISPGAAPLSRVARWVRHWPRPLRLALANALRRRQRLVLTVLSLAAGGAVLVGAGNLRGAVQDSTEQLFATQGWQLTLRLASPQAAADAVAAAQAVSGVQAVEAWRGARAQRLGENNLPHDSLSLVGVQLPSTLLRPRLLAGRWLQAHDQDALVLSRSLALDQNDLQPGQSLALLVQGQQRRFQIVGVVDSGPQPLAYVSRVALNRALGSAGDQASSLIVALQASSPAGQLEATVRLRQGLNEAGVPVAASQLQAENRRVVDDHLLMVVDFLAVMGWVMMAVGGLALASTMGLSVLERQRELGVMRAIGASNAALLGLIQAEGLMVTLMAWLLCLPLSVPIAVLLGEAFGRVMFSVPLRWWPEPAAALAWLALMLVVSLLACAAPAWRAMRMPAARALAYEG